MSHYFLNFLIATFGMVGLLYLVYLYVRQNPQLANGFTPAGRKASGSLKLESALTLEPRKTLYVVCVGEERFLLSTSADKTELLSPLNPLPLSLASPIMQAEAQGERLENVSQTTYDIPHGTFMDRFRSSVQWVVRERFMGVGRK